jgi:hypothetical protein
MKITAQTIVLLAAIVLPTTGWSDNWVNVPEGSEHQVDTDSITNSGAFVLAWVRSIYPLPMEFSGKLAYSEKSHISIGCAKKTQTTSQTITFTDPNSTAPLNTFTGNPSPDSYRRPEPVEKVIQSFVCRVASQRR